MKCINSQPKMSLTCAEAAESEGKPDHHRVVKHLGQGDSEEQLVVGLAHFLEQPEFSISVQSNIILEGDPNQGHQTVKEPSIEVLKSVPRLEWLEWVRSATVDQG